jgi:effector-binding domain-containing protein
MIFEKKNIESQKVAFIKHIGDVEEMGVVIGNLMEWVSKNNIQIMGAPLAIYYTDPSMVNPNEMVYDMLIPVSEDVKGDDDVKIKTLPSCTVISAIHKVHMRPYLKLIKVYGIIL